MLEFADIDVECDAAQMIAPERVSERLLVDDLAARDIDQDAAGFHQGKALGIEQPVGFRRPLTADHDKIAGGEKPVEIRRAADLGEPGRQGLARLRRAPGADDPHAEPGAEPPDILADAAGADDTDRLAIEQQRAVWRDDRTSRPGDRERSD